LIFFHCFIYESGSYAIADGLFLKIDAQRFHRRSTGGAAGPARPTSLN